MSLELKTTFWFTICNFLLKGISFITVPLFTKYLSTQEYGLVSIYNSYQQIFLIFATMELSLGAYQRGILKFKNKIRLFTQSIQTLWSIITLILFFLVFMFRDTFIRLTSTNITILTLMFVYFLVQPAYDSWINLKRFKYDYKSVVIITLLFSILSTIIPLLCVVYIRPTGVTRITSMLIVQILFCIPFYLKNINISEFVNNFSYVKKMWKFALKFQLPLVMHSLSYLVLAQSDRIMIGALVGKTEAALYSVAYSLANVVIIFQTSINQVLKPWRYNKMEIKDYQAINHITNVLLVIIGMLLLLFILVAPEIMKCLFNDDYYEAIWTIPPVTMSVYFMFLYSVFTDIESYFLKTKYIMYASVICALLNIAFNYFGIIYFGYISCAYATLISYILFAVLHYYFMRKSCKIAGLYTKIFNSKKIIIISIICVLLMSLFVFLYSCFIIRLMIIFTISIFCILKRNVIILQLKILKER